jgi:hypothetical protein
MEVPCQLWNVFAPGVDEEINEPGDSSEMKGAMFE